MPFDTTPSGDWDGLRAFLEEKLDAPYRGKR
jgi:hypothetical protein